MNSSVIQEEYILPSRGKVYLKKVNPIIKLGSMVTEHEMKRLAPSERPFKNLCEIIDDCLLEPIGISAYDLCMADYMYVLQKLRVVTYGKEYKVLSRCPYCSSESEINIDLDKLEVTPFDANNFAELSEFTLPKTEKRIKIIMQTPRISDEITVRSKEMRRKTKGLAGDSAFLYTLQMIIENVDGDRLDAIQSEDFIRQLPMMDTNYIVQHENKLVESFGVKNEVNCVCSFCGLDYTNSFRIGPDFFRPSIDI